MKALDEIKKQKPIFIGWTDKIDLVGDFENINLDERQYRKEASPWPNTKYWEEEKRRMDSAINKYEKIDILFAAYECADYEGEAFVLFVEDGALFEVNGGHCSCYGLEGQWRPEATTLEAIGHRLKEGRFGEDFCKAELESFLGISSDA